MGDVHDEALFDESARQDAGGFPIVLNESNRIGSAGRVPPRARAPETMLAEIRRQAGVASSTLRFGRMFAARTRLRMRMATGVTSTSSSC